MAVEVRETALTGIDTDIRLPRLQQQAERRGGRQLPYLTQLAAQDREHAQRVARLALALFDELGRLHKLGNDARRLLAAAALLHDVGKSKARKGHHKTSLKMILHCQKLPLDADERLIVGLVARYHRASVPKDSHKHFGNLHKDGKHVVQTLAAILRLADGLDNDWRGRLVSMTCKIGAEAVWLNLCCKPGQTRDPRLPARRTILFESTFAKPVLVRCRAAPGTKPRARSRAAAHAA